MTPDTRSSLRFLWSILKQRPALLTGTTVSGALWMLPMALLPLVVGVVIDAGIGGGDPTALWLGVLAVLALVIVQTAGAAGLEWATHTLWIHGTATAQRVSLRHLTGLGPALNRKVRAGEVVAIGASDIQRVGELFEVLGRATGSLVSFVVAAVIAVSVSPTLGLFVLVGVPLATLGIGPLLAASRKREETQRERMGTVNGLAADIVAGLRILRGVGGERRFHGRFVAASQQLREAGVSVGRIDALLAAAEILLPGLVTVVITWLGARSVLAGEIGIGELVAFYGLSAFLVIPVSTATEAAHSYSEAIVAAGRICALLRLRPTHEVPTDPVPLPEKFCLRDEISGLEIAAGELTVVDAGVEGEAFAERLAGHVDAKRVFADEVPLADVDPGELRRRILLAHNQDTLFSGPARPGLDLGTAVDLDSALHAADATDVLDALPADAVLDEQARSLSGGQRQRLLLARALCADADVLVLDEPTSAVDAHTESRIVQRVRESRVGRTTVVVSQSPLWKNAADRVLEGRAS